MPERSNVTTARLEPFDKTLDSHRACENYPVERIDSLDRSIQHRIASRRCGFDRRKFHHLRAEPPQRRRELGRSHARARYYDGAAEQRRALDPLQMLAHARELSDDDYGRRADSFALG